jgi:AcrR family transcriptional regulator
VPTEKQDRRSQRTRRLLGEALVALLAEQRYDALTVQAIIVRANVGRTTFYTHFRDKDDLLLHELERMVHQLGRQAHGAGQAGPAGLPSLLLFRHVREFQSVYQALVWGRDSELIFKRIQLQVAGLIEPQLAARVRPDHPPAVPLPLLAHFVAGSFLTLLKWWMDDRLAYTPEQMDAMFWTLVQPSLAAGLGGER